VILYHCTNFEQNEVSNTHTCETNYMHGLEKNLRRDDVVDIVVKNIVEKKDAYFRIALSLCGNKDDSMDAVSEMILIAIHKYETLLNKDAFMSWSSKILINICRKYLRQRKHIVYIEDHEEEIANTDRSDELSLDMQLALSSMKPIYREVIVLKEILGYTYKEIAVIMQIPVGTAQSRCDYGLKDLRKKLGGYHNE